MAKSNNSYHGQLALVTGGSMGMGLALAQLLAEEGANVWLVARHTDTLDAACRSLSVSSGQKHGVFAADVTKLDQAQAAAEHVKREAGVPDLLVNCAGAAHPGYVQELPLEIFHDMMDLNYFGALYMVKTLLPAMLERGSGHIVNVSSMAGFLGAFGYSAYGAAKYAVRGFSDVLRLEVKPLGIRVSVVFPPDMDTPGLANENKTKPFETFAAGSTKALPPQEVAKSTLRAMKRGQYVILPGFEPQLFYRAMFLAGNAIYPIMDGMIADARKKKAKNAR
jgi:3-dehydrosphinganine reductase